MTSHQPPGYTCPFCAVVAGRDTSWNAQSDVVFRDAATTAFISPKWWDAAPAHVLVVPNEHFENVYVIPESLLGSVYATSRRIACALKASHECDGTSMRQHNEPGGGQDVWHFHVHVFPRRERDRLYARNGETRLVSVDERAPWAERVRDALAEV